MRPGDSSRNLLVALGAVAAACLTLPWLAPHDPLALMVDERLLAPGGDHWLGTDDLGRDVASRVMVGTARTVAISVAALVSSLVIGIFFGAVAGYFYRRWPDRLLVWSMDLISSVPFLLIMTALLSIVGPGSAKAYIVLSLVIWPAPARIVRSEVIKTLPLPYVLSERAVGVPEWDILFRKVLPNCVDAAVIFSVTYLPDIIALEAALSFLGLGVQPPEPGLGKMIFDGMNYASIAPWMIATPTAALFAIVLAVKLLAWRLGVPVAVRPARREVAL
jgi:peptide/nickel transport system permease protein